MEFCWPFRSTNIIIAKETNEWTRDTMTRIETARERAGRHAGSEIWKSICDCSVRAEFHLCDGWIKLTVLCEYSEMRECLTYVRESFFRDSLCKCERARPFSAHEIAIRCRLGDRAALVNRTFSKGRRLRHRPVPHSARALTSNGITQL